MFFFRTSGFLDETSEGQFREIVEALPDDGGDDTCSDELADAGKRKSRISSSSAEQQRQQLIEKSAAIANSMKGKRDQHCDLSLSVDASRPLDTESEVIAARDTFLISTFLNPSFLIETYLAYFVEK